MLTGDHASVHGISSTETTAEQFQRGLEIASQLMALAQKLREEGGLLWEIDAARIQDILDWSLAQERPDGN
ncbi:MAG: hypothetical protein AB7I79_15255 [Rhizobiaceae bacterium]